MGLGRAGALLRATRPKREPWGPVRASQAGVKGTRVCVGVGGAQRLTEASRDTGPRGYKTPGRLKAKGAPQSFLWARQGDWCEVLGIEFGLLSP